MPDVGLPWEPREKIKLAWNFPFQTKKKAQEEMWTRLNNMYNEILLFSKLFIKSLELSAAKIYFFEKRVEVKASSSIIFFATAYLHHQAAWGISLIWREIKPQNQQWYQTVPKFFIKKGKIGN